MVNGNAVIVALDHGLHWGAYEGFEDPGSTLRKVLGSRPDGVLASPPFLREFKETISDHDVVTVATLDILHDSTIPGKDEGAEIQDLVFGVEEANEVGADAVKIVLIYGRQNPDVLRRNLKYVAEVAVECSDYDIPLVVEPTLWGKRIENDLDPDLLADANRIAFELGADVLKSPYSGTPDSFEPIVKNSPLPVYIAGGPAVETDVEVLEMVEGAMGVGAEGVIFGRNIWQRDNPTAIVEAIKEVVHSGESVEEAQKHLE